MIPQGLFTQIGMVIVSIAIIITYVKPIFTEIESMQSDIAVYQEKRESVASVNAKLATLVARLESVSSDDRRGLNTYMPDEVDTISVTRDLFFITQQAGVFYIDAYAEPTSKNNKSSKELVDNTPLEHTFQLSVEGTYQQLKNLISLIERNNYPLEIHSLDVTELEGGFLSAELSLVTYAYQNLAITGSNKVEF